MIHFMVVLSLLLVTLAVARITRLIVSDRIFLFLRRWVVNKWGEDSEMAALAHCKWCSSVWIAFPAAWLWAIATLPLKWWWLALPAWMAMSDVTGLLARLEEE